MQAFLATGPPEGASIVNISSVVGNFVASGEPWHSAARTAIVGYTRMRDFLDRPGFQDILRRHAIPVDGALSITR